jgi:hypothetical protein
MEWSYDACGIYFIYRKYIIINQEHPNLVKYAIYEEDSQKSLIFIDTASTIKLAKEFVNKYIEDGRTIEIRTESNSQISQTTQGY